MKRIVKIENLFEVKIFEIYVLMSSDVKIKLRNLKENGFIKYLLYFIMKINVIEKNIGCINLLNIVRICFWNNMGFFVVGFVFCSEYLFFFFILKGLWMMIFEEFCVFIFYDF